MSYLPVIAFAAPLGTDSAAVCTAMGAKQRIIWRRRLVIAGVLTSFEAGMPAVGMAASGPVGDLFGAWSARIAGVILVLLGAWMLRSDDDDETEADAGISWGPLLALGVAVSIDEIAVGVSLGLAGVALVPLVATIGGWVFVATMTGLTLGAKLGARFQRHAGTAAAAALMVLGVLVGTHVL